ncbi:hypothetical protein [Magnetospirillum gryphiswaldense]|uniref:hypothetical protein n=1 Tax=Magnetospirillum gryphiswaldense TaxID=55518 RepID=UPI000D0444ED|nr:hypothetical protein [Magnetospirillum gryphiswaldense]
MFRALLMALRQCAEFIAFVTVLFARAMIVPILGLAAMAWTISQVAWHRSGTRGRSALLVVAAIATFACWWAMPPLNEIWADLNAFAAWSNTADPATVNPHEGERSIGERAFDLVKMAFLYVTIILVAVGGI